LGVILALANQKGGCGKTTSAIHLAAAYARRDLRVLLIDLDPQGHATMGLGVEPAEGRPALSDALAHTPLSGVGAGLELAIQAARPGLDIVPANLGLAGLELRLATVPGREERLAEHLAEIADGWDVIVLDSPPNLGLLTINALVAAGQVLVPVEPSPFSLQALERVLDTIRAVEEHTGHRVTTRVLPTMVAARDAHGVALIDRLQAARPGMVLPARIRRSVLFPRAASAGKTIGELSPHCPAWQDYIDAADAIAEAWRAEISAGRPRFLGLRVCDGGVEFSHPDLEPDEVRLAGEFNDWDPDRGVELHDRGVRGWSKRLRLAPGHYEYKFILRSDWVPDPANPRRAQSAMGAVNSIIDVPGPRAARPAPGASRPETTSAS
jgi:chromosome partitioning protein